MKHNGIKENERNDRSGTECRTDENEEEKKLEEAFKLMLKSQVDNVSDGLIDDAIKWWKMKNNENNITMSPDEAEFIELLMKHPELHDKLKEILS